MKSLKKDITKKEFIEKVINAFKQVDEEKVLKVCNVLLETQYTKADLDKIILSMGEKDLEIIKKMIRERSKELLKGIIEKEELEDGIKVTKVVKVVKGRIQIKQIKR